MSEKQPHFLFPPDDMALVCKPILISACFMGVSCKWHGRPMAVRSALLERLKRSYILVPVCPEQLGGLPTPRTHPPFEEGMGEQTIHHNLQIFNPETGDNMTENFIRGAKETVALAHLVGAKKAYLKKACVSCDRTGVTGYLLEQAGISVVAVS